jgi:class 3 adenylate cyclase
MVPGNKMCAIFGFCDIRGFAVINEVLKQDIITFVNEVAFIVHDTVDLYAGATNKNIGEAWLLVWKVPDSETYHGHDNKGPQKMIKESSKVVNNLADLALISMLKIWCRVNKA